MQIQVKCSCGADHCPEWAVIELQGVIEVEPSFQDRIQNLKIGLLCRPSSQQEMYTFTIGYHELEGSVVTLKKPMLVLKKLKHMDIDQENGSRSPMAVLDVIGIIRKKILFKTRPKPLISKPAVVPEERAGRSASFVSTN